MVMSQGTYTFLACFAGFWLVWALIVMLCCFCSFVQRRLKRQREERLRERCLRTLEMEPLGHRGYPPREPPHSLPPHPQAPLTWTGTQEADAVGKPPCYEEAVLMEDPPPPYSEVLADPRAGTYTKPAPGTSRKQQDTKTSKTGPDAAFSERPFSLIHLPVDEHWDSLGRLLSAMDLNRNNLPPTDAQAHPLAAVPRGGRTNSELGLEHTCALPTAFPLFGRSTAV